ncbi:MAG: hypothetical protein ABI091_18065 [Ferruginibacter sp.]
MYKTLLIFSVCAFATCLKADAQSSVEVQPPSVATSKSALKIKISTGATGFTNGMKIIDAVVTVDTTIRVSPKTAYLSIDIAGITGSNMAEILGGKNSFWITDKNGKEIKSTERFLKQVKGSLESPIVNYTVKIPFKLKSDLVAPYTVRYLFETKDKQKSIDIVATR